MKPTAAGILVDRLVAWGVDTVFGLPGDGINGLMEALRQRQEQIRFVHVRHEEAAAFAACGYAKFTGRLGVCLATSGPGGVHLLNGLYDAKLDGVPVLAITGMTYHDLVGTMYQQDVQTDYLFHDVAVFNQRVMGASHVVNLVDQAVRTAVARRGVAHLAFPLDLQEQEAGKDTRSRHDPAGHARPLEIPTVRVPTAADVAAAAAVFEGRRKTVILAGSGARGAAQQLEAVAERLAAPIVKPLLGKDVFADDSPYCLGGIGLLGTRPAQHALEECEALLIVGSSFPYMDYLPKPGQAVAVQVDDDPSRLGLRYPVERALAGDAGATLELLLRELPANADRSFLEACQAEAAGWWKGMETLGTQPETPMKPEVLAWNLGGLLDDDAILCCDTGTVTFWAAQQVRLRRGQRFAASGNLASMANGLPYGIGAQVAYPDRQVVVFAGDGGFEMLMADFATCVQHGLPVKVVVVKNNTLGMIKWEQMVFLGNPEYGVGMTPIDFVKFAEACGGRGVRIEDPGRCREQLAEALKVDGPVIIEAVVDPFEAPLPPKMTREQSLHMARALARGEPNRERIALTLFRESVRAGAIPGPSPVGKIARKVSELLGPDDQSDGSAEEES